jgi:hypothetical protein
MFSEEMTSGRVASEKAMFSPTKRRAIGVGKGLHSHAMSSSHHDCSGLIYCNKKAEETLLLQLRESLR